MRTPRSFRERSRMQGKTSYLHEIPNIGAFTHDQYTQTESNRLKAKTIRVSSRIKDFRLTGSPFSGTRLTGSQVANKCAGR